MAISLSSLRSSTSTKPPIVLIYGVDGVGKTSLAAEFPDALYLPTAGERTPEGIDLPTPGTVETFDDLKDIFGELLSEDHEIKTVIVDSLDGLEPIMHAETCRRIGATSIDSNDKGSPTSFGRGYVEADVEWNEFMGACRSLADRGVAVVLLAHPEIVRFDSPITDPYSRYGVKLHKRAAAIVREQSDLVAFINYRISLKTKEVAPKKEVTHAEGGKERLIHLTEAAGFVAKSRYQTPDSVVYKKGQGYAELSKYFPEPRGVTDEAAA